MKVTKVNIPFFKGGKAIQLEFEKDFFPAIFPIGGCEGSGKSALLELLFILLTCWEHTSREHIVRSVISAYIYIPTNIGVGTVAEVELWDGNQYTPIEFCINVSEESYELLPVDVPGVSIYLLRHYTDVPAFMGGYLNYDLRSHSFVYRSEFQEVKEALEECFMTYEDLYFFLGEWGEMSISQLKYKSIFSWLSDIKDSIVLMDNPTEFFHPDDQYNLCTELKAHTRESNNQFLLGTHSHELCTALTPAHVKVID